MTTKEIYESIDQSKISPKGKEFLQKVEKSTKGFTIENDKLDKTMRKIYSDLKERKPEALKDVKVKTVTKTEKVPTTKAEQKKEPKKKTKTVKKQVKKATGKKKNTKPTKTPSTPKGGKKEHISTRASKLAKKEGISFKEARAKISKVVKEEKAQAVKQTEKELDKLLRFVRKESFEGEEKYPKTYGKQKPEDSSLSLDAKRKAKPVGKRISKDGNTYYEYRDNRSDRNSLPAPKGEYRYKGATPPYLEAGGTLPENFGQAGLVGETGTMNEVDLFAMGGDLPQGVHQYYANTYNPAYPTPHGYEKGGKISKVKSKRELDKKLEKIQFELGKSQRDHKAEAIEHGKQFDELGSIRTRISKLEKGGMMQGYNDRLDESLGNRDGVEPMMMQSYKDRRDESKGMEKAMGRRAYQSVGTMDKMANGGKTDDVVVKQEVYSSNGNTYTLEEYQKLSNEELMDRKPLDLSVAKAKLFEYNEEAYDYEDEIMDIKDVDELADFVYENDLGSIENTYNSSWWGGVRLYILVHNDGNKVDFDEPTMVFMSFHRGGDVRGNYEKYEAFDMQGYFYEEFPIFVDRMTVTVEKDGKSLTGATEDMEGYDLYIQQSDFDEFEEDDSTNLDELGDKLGFEGYQYYKKGGKIGFDGLAKKVAKRYVGKPVPKKFQKEYGKRYSKEEAMEVGEKVASKVYRKQQGMEKGGEVDAFVMSYVKGVPQEDTNLRVDTKKLKAKLKKGGKLKQGYNDQLDESLGIRKRNRRMKMQNFKDRRDESKGMEKSLGRRAYSSVRAMDKGRRKLKHGGKIGYRE